MLDMVLTGVKRGPFCPGVFILLSREKWYNAVLDNFFIREMEKGTKLCQVRGRLLKPPDY